MARMTAAAGICLCVGIATSVLFNVPSNIAIVEAGDPSLPGFDASLVRAQFGEDQWVTWNHVRAFTSTLAFGLLAWSFRLQAAPQHASTPTTHTVAQLEMA